MSNALTEAHELLSNLDESGLAAAHALLRVVKEIQVNGASRINKTAEATRQLDEVDQLAILTYAQFFVEDGIIDTESEPLKWLERPLRHHVFLVKQAEGVFSSYHRELRAAFRETGEFYTTEDFAECAQSLELSTSNGALVSDFLYKWVAAQQPGSKAADYVNTYTLPSGKLSTKRGYHSREPLYLPASFLFHRTVLEDYVDQECFEGDRYRSVINPIVTLLARDDWEFAVSQLSAVQRRKLG